MTLRVPISRAKIRSLRSLRSLGSLADSAFLDAVALLGGRPRLAGLVAGASGLTACSSALVVLAVLAEALLFFEVLHYLLL